MSFAASRESLAAWVSLWAAVLQLLAAVLSAVSLGAREVDVLYSSHAVLVAQEVGRGRDSRVEFSREAWQQSQRSRRQCPSPMAGPVLLDG